MPNLIPSISEIVPTPPPNQVRQTCRPDQTPGWKIIIEYGAFIFSAVAVVIYYLQLDATQQTMRLDERAWVSVTSAKLTRPYSVDSKGMVLVSLANTGKTPALHMKVEKAAFSDKEDAVDLVPTASAETVAPPNSTQNTIPLAIHLGIPGDTKLFIKFVLTYRDVLQKPSDPPHMTTFCGFYPPDDAAEDRTTLMACLHGGNSMN